MERQARRAQVLYHAKRLFALQGYHRTNISDIVAQARIARGTFYLYFQNKKELFEELLNEALREISARIHRIRLGPNEPSPAQQLRDNIVRVLDFVLAEPHPDVNQLAEQILDFGLRGVATEELLRAAPGRTLEKPH